MRSSRESCPVALAAASTCGGCDMTILLLTYGTCDTHSSQGVMSHGFIYSIPLAAAPRIATCEVPGWLPLPQVRRPGAQERLARALPADRRPGLRDSRV